MIDIETAGRYRRDYAIMVYYLTLPEVQFNFHHTCDIDVCLWTFLSQLEKSGVMRLSLEAFLTQVHSMLSLGSHVHRYFSRLLPFGGLI